MNSILPKSILGASLRYGCYPYCKESQEFASILLLDYGARFYNPTATRWTTMDPLAEKYYSVSPYAFCSGNPVNFVDWDGDSLRVVNMEAIAAIQFRKIHLTGF